MASIRKKKLKIYSLGKKLLFSDTKYKKKVRSIHFNFIKFSSSTHIELVFSLYGGQSFNHFYNDYIFFQLIIINGDNQSAILILTNFH